MTISIVKKTLKYSSPRRADNGKLIEPEVKEKVLSEFKTTPEVATAILELLSHKDNYSSFNKDNNIEFSSYMSSDSRADNTEEEVIIKFSK